MKISVTLRLFSVVVGLSAIYAATPRPDAGYVQGPTTFNQIQIRPEFDADGQIKSFAVTAICDARRVENFGPSGRRYTDATSLEIDFAANAAKSCQIGDRKCNYGQTAADFAAICQQEWRAKYPPGASAEHYRNLREPAKKYQPGPGQPVP
jgi:hypothetical protein